MSIKERINVDFMEAFKAKDMEKKNFLGVIKGEIQNETSRSGKDDDETVLGILKRMEKSLTQTNTEESLKEIEYIKPYLPKMMEYDEIEEIIEDYYDQNGLLTMGDMMKMFNASYKGKADNKIVSSIINKTIAGR
jgi:uncharacterized protein YqeY